MKRLTKDEKTKAFNGRLQTKLFIKGKVKAIDEEIKHLKNEVETREIMIQKLLTDKYQWKREENNLNLAVTDAEKFKRFGK